MTDPNAPNRQPYKPPMKRSEIIAKLESIKSGTAFNRRPSPQAQDIHDLAEIIENLLPYLAVQ